MTKHKQPRDENGKFVKQTPMIALHGKNGSTAYFSSIEEMEDFAKETKIEFKKKEEKNPDCEPATRKYVKCLLRKYTQHKHEPCGFWLASIIGAVIGWLFTFAVYTVSAYPKDLYSTSVANTWLIPLFLFSVACTIFTYEIHYIATTNTTSDTTTHPELDEYTPPTCEKKDECD
jgi:hypothetical protein